MHTPKVEVLAQHLPIRIEFVDTAEKVEEVLPTLYEMVSDGLIEVLNEGSYVMAEYSERTGIVKWQRVVLATQKEKIEKWLFDHYPAHTHKGKAAVAQGNGSNR